jgi:hypothetical protein
VASLEVNKYLEYIIMSPVIENVLKEIDLLSNSEKKDLYHKLREIILDSKVISVDLEKYRAAGKDIWMKDAQEYIDLLRNDDRI